MRYFIDERGQKIFIKIELVSVESEGATVNYAIGFNNP